MRMTTDNRRLKMKRTLFALLALCGCALEATAQVTDITAIENVVYIDPITAEAGQATALPVKMKNAVPAEGFQFNLTLPEGMTLVTEKDGEPVPVVALSDERGLSAFNLFSSVRQYNSLTVLAGSVTGQAATGNDGTVCTVMARVAADMAAGDYELAMKNIAISDSEARSYNTPSLTCRITIADQTAIRDISSDGTGSAHVYSLQGLQLSDSQASGSHLRKGLYIKGGKKVIIGR